MTPTSPLMITTCGTQKNIVSPLLHVTCDQRLVARQYFYRNPENEALVASPSPSISNHSLYYEPSEHSSDVPVVWLFDQLPYTSYHSEDNSAASSVPSSPAPSTSSIQSSVN